MRDSRHPVLPAVRTLLAGPSAARLLVVVLGLLGFVVGPVGAGAHAGASATGVVSGVRTVPAQQAPTRPRTSAKSRTAGNARAVIAAVARHAAARRRR
ncbi:hypothetical protein [Actinomadura sp. BRA 177]|uniref:hypothetical protein n=1 Tax=Actinomadura sp. BRA 177 TaxID=2745202 RepID=UPI001595F390|nr:hypothetical protein [Actinomadura sp. BRA 177]NVI91652.1 hypothetical protein [Actinomadura sp. BRA 177]